MPFDSEVKDSWGLALASFRDGLQNLTNWSLLQDISTTAEIEVNDYFVFETATPAEQIRFIHTNGGVKIEHGLDWDTADETWNNQWPNDPATAQPLDGGVGYVSANAATDDPGAYWFGRWDRGFNFYFQREVGDGSDNDLFIGMERIDKAWPYDTANANETEWVLAMADSTVGDDETNGIYEWLSGSGSGNNNYRARGQVNPDTNFDNYPLTNTILSSSQFRTVSGQDTVIGTSNLWIQDNSGSDTGHRDLIQDSNANDIYTILTRQPNLDIAMRMVDALP